MKKQAGFTLIELIASLFILMSVLQIFSFILSSMNATRSLRDSMIAANLAQEGIEVVRNIRDRDWFLGNTFGASLPSGSGRVQWNSNFIITSSGDPVLKRDSTTGIFSYDSGTDTSFRRTINITAVSANEVKVTSTVDWGTATSPRSTSAEAHLFSWYNP